MKPDFLEINGAACRFALEGEGNRTLVLIHELAGSLNSWDDFLPLLPAGLRILRYDMRGAGLSEKVAGRLDLDSLADDIAALLEATKVTGQVTIAGAAIGAAIAVRFAARHASRCARLVLIGPALGVPAERHAAALELSDKIDRDGLRAIAETLLPKAFPDPLWRDGAARRRAIARWLGADPQGYAAAYRMLADADLSGDLASLAMPVLVLAGRHDPFATPDIVSERTRAIKHREFAIVEGGHFMHIQSPAQLADAVRPFLAA